VYKRPEAVKYEVGVWQVFDQRCKAVSYKRTRTKTALFQKRLKI